MRSYSGFVVALLWCVIAIGRSVSGQSAPLRDWKDPSPHGARFVTVDSDVSVEVLDWGGSGRPLILLAGSGHSAHVFDDFAPKLTPFGHVYGITRRGWGASSQPSTGYDNSRLSRDVLLVLDAINATDAVLIGHSAAGHEMTTAARQSDRLGGLVYLDALGDSDSDPALNAEWRAILSRLPPAASQRSCQQDRSSFPAFRQSQACSMGFQLPEAEWRNTFNTNNDGSVGAFKTPQTIRALMGAGHQHPRDYSGIRLPVLALFEFPRTSLGQLRAEDPSPRNEEERALVIKFALMSKAIIDRAATRLVNQVANARVVNVEGAGHYLFITREAQVVQEVGNFVASLQRK